MALVKSTCPLLEREGSEGLLEGTFLNFQREKIPCVHSRFDCTWPEYSENTMRYLTKLPCIYDGHMVICDMSSAPCKLGLFGRHICAAWKMHDWIWDGA